MARDEAPPFVRGGTYYQGGSIDTTSLGGVNLEGKEYKFEDTVYGTGMYVTCRIVRNSGTFNLRPKRMVSFDSSYYGQRVNGYTATTGGAGFPVDELLPAAGVPPNDLFYVVVDGPAAVLTPLDAGADNVVNVGDILAAITAATTGATTAGRVASLDATAATFSLGTERNAIGRAISAATTANTDKSLVAIIHKWL
jgi:hypothetical protein